MTKEDFLNKWIDALPLNSKDSDRKEMEYDLDQLQQEQDGKTEQLSAEEFLKSKTVCKPEQILGYVLKFDELTDLLEEYSKQNNDDFQLQRLYDWLMNENREPAKTKFTAGTLRNVANEIEFRLKQSNWISVEDRLPDLENTYIVCLDGCIDLADFIIDKGEKFWHNCIGITHWQPSPQPPKQ